jgi:hypothetical protein
MMYVAKSVLLQSLVSRTYILAVLPQWVATVHTGRTQKLHNRVHCNQPVNKKHITLHQKKADMPSQKAGVSLT